jgi:hypothetical protein
MSFGLVARACTCTVTRLQVLGLAILAKRRPILVVKIVAFDHPELHRCTLRQWIGIAFGRGRFAP